MSKVQEKAEDWGRRLSRSMNMLAWLYDEDRWPSGFAGGYVTEKEENRQRYLLMTPKKETAEEGKILADEIDEFIGLCGL